MMELISQLGELLAEFARIMKELWALIRLALQQALTPIGRVLPNFADAFSELYKRSWALRQTGAESFVPPGLEEGFTLSAWALENLPTIAGAVLLVSALAVVMSILAPRVLSIINAVRNERSDEAYMSNAEREILTRGGSYAGLSSDLGKTWRSGAAEQERIKALYNLNAGNATSGGSGTMDDDNTDDWQKLIGTTNKKNAGNSIPISQSLPHYDSGHYSVQTSESQDGLNPAGLQSQRLEAIENGDIASYNGMLQQHGKRIRHNTGKNPGSSGFYPGK